MADATTKGHGTPNWADCATGDLTASEDFYKSVFGWQSERVTASDGAVYAIQRLEGKMVAGLYELTDQMRALGVPPHWGTYVEVADVPATLEKVTEAGGTVIEGPSEEPQVGAFALIQDPVGAYLHLWTSAPAHGGEVFNIPGAMTWNELCTKEPEKAAAFYQAALGLESAVVETPSPYVLLKRDGHEVAGIFRPPPEMGDLPATWDVYFGSADADATVEAAVAAGGTVIRPPFDIAGGAARMAVLKDPQGAVFEIMQMMSEPS